ncbi:PLD nuclease N-terminal domain-containing protein [Agromyces larvae]|uniref:PLD nuclease N-terminal domain-containing protein n=1 Tax=Agromyces larvae TaxID=2929802 RepID=A0ABY4C1F7_9MICO|nr:PLD nuclease N-terminal domain-containing protein [Agromyces larvae]UOE43796.1 PLD nuclease N-terminal domain-containing protein [Agromyces larvae]
MLRVWFGLAVAAAVFMVYSVVDCALFDRTRIRGVARGWWILIIVFVPVIGGILWFWIGRGPAARVGGHRGGPIAPDDDPDFLRRLERDAAQDERIRRLEQELAELDDDASGPRDDPGGRHDPRPHRDPGTDGAAGETGPNGRPNA